jgi:HK97 family phage major capsid protein
MPTIAKVIATTESQRLAAERRRSDAEAGIKTLLSRAQAEGRDRLTAPEDGEVDRLMKAKRAAGDEAKRLAGQLEAYRQVEAEEADAIRLASQSIPTAAGERYSGPSVDGHPRALRVNQRMADWAAHQSPGLATIGGEHLSFDRMIRGLATGQWDGAEAEKRSIQESPLSSGGYLVPTPVASQVIDKARNATRCLQAGALTIPMSSSTLKYPRLLTEGTPAWRNENATITDQNMTFDQVVFTAQSMAILVKCSWELFEDADQADDQVIENSFARTIALELDRVMLRGSGTSPEPRGVRNQSGVTVTSHGVNGDTIANLTYNFLVDAQATVRASNFEPNAVIDAPRTEQGLAKLKDSTSQYVQPPPGLLPRYPTNQVPINLTVGTSADCSEVYSGQWDQLLLGLRAGLTIRFLAERFADSGQYAFLASLRGDVQVAQAAAFVVDVGVRS